MWSCHLEKEEQQLPESNKNKLQWKATSVPSKQWDQHLCILSDNMKRFQVVNSCHWVKAIQNVKKNILLCIIYKTSVFKVTSSAQLTGCQYIWLKVQVNLELNKPSGGKAELRADIDIHCFECCTELQVISSCSESDKQKHTCLYY